MTRLSKFLAATAIITAGLIGQSNATAIVSQTSFDALYQACKTSCGTISTGSLTTLNGPKAVISDISSAYGLQAGNTGDLLTFTPSTISINSTFTETLTWDTYTFTASSIQITTGPTTVGYLFLGTFVDSANLIAPGTADLSITLNQVSANGAISATVQFDTPSAIPEPVSMAVLGLGLVGLAATRRSRSI